LWESNHYASPYLYSSTFSFSHPFSLHYDFAYAVSQSDTISDPHSSCVMLFEMQEAEESIHSDHLPFDVSFQTLMFGDA
jgi:hypothetical protein